MKPLRYALCIIPLIGYAVAIACTAASIAVALACMTVCKWLKK